MSKYFFSNDQGLGLYHSSQRMLHSNSQAKSQHSLQLGPCLLGPISQFSFCVHTIGDSYKLFVSTSVSTRLRLLRHNESTHIIECRKGMPHKNFWKRLAGSSCLETEKVRARLPETMLSGSLTLKSSYIR